MMTRRADVRPGQAAVGAGALLAAKRGFYRQPEVAASYDEQRFGGASGAYVNARELRLVAALLPAAGVVADVGCGTGRALPALRQRARWLLAFDASLPMLQAAAGRGADRLVQADAFALPVAAGACDAVTCIRLLFHFDDPVPLLRELRRITRVGGTLVCDTCTWSPRALLPLDRRHWGERVFPISRARFRALAQAAGWRVRAERPCFLLSPYLYRRLPPWAARALERLEEALPSALLCRVFWALEAAEPEPMAT